jgi:DNA-binding NarL/FixJ family response regulator
MSIKLLIADDETLFRQSLRVLLESGTNLKVVAEATNGQEAVMEARDAKPDLALLDVDMPKMDGIKAAKLITTVSPRTKILMLSVHHEDEKVNSAMRAGALGYVLKDTDRNEFINIIRQTHAGKTPASPFLANPSSAQQSEGAPTPSAGQLEEFASRFGLTALELQILSLVAEGLSNEEISQTIHLARETVKGHLKSLFRKLEVKNRTEAAVMAVRKGIG